jgi:amidophosphoribosyltransferase
VCGIVGLVGAEDAAFVLHEALNILQHRGQDAAGILTDEDGHFHLRRGNGLVRDVFPEGSLASLRGRTGLGHVRYPTAGTADATEAQPFYTNAPYGLGLVHNGNLTNAEALRTLLFREDRRHLNTFSDSEVLLNVLAHELQVHGGMRLAAEEIFAAIATLHRRCAGAYSALALIAGVGLLAFRDPFGIRPLVWGVRESGGRRQHLFASESVALDVLGFRLVRDLAPGEAVLARPDGTVESEICALVTQRTPCLFEYVYLARPDSIIEGVSVHKARLRMGERLAEKILRVGFPGDADVVIPIPDTSRMSALQLANRLGLKYREGFIKNRYVGRTFIMPEAGQRRRSVRRKLNPIGLEFQGKNVLLVDDSIVRGTTSREIVEMARRAGARRVYFASAAPPVRYPNVYGIDMPARDELIAAGRSEEDVARFIGADALIYQDLSDLAEAVKAGNPALERFEDSCFSGRYVTGDVTPEYLEHLARARRGVPAEGLPV